MNPKWRVRALTDRWKWWYVEGPDGDVRLFPTGFQDALDYANACASRAMSEVP